MPARTDCPLAFQNAQHLEKLNPPRSRFLFELLEIRRREWARGQQGLDLLDEPPLVVAQRDRVLGKPQQAAVTHDGLLGFELLDERTEQLGRQRARQLVAQFLHVAPRCQGMAGMEVAQRGEQCVLETLPLPMGRVDGLSIEAGDPDRRDLFEQVASILLSKVQKLRNRRDRLREVVALGQKQLRQFGGVAPLQHRECVGEPWLAASMRHGARDG